MVRKEEGDGGWLALKAEGEGGWTELAGVGDWLSLPGGELTPCKEEGGEGGWLDLSEGEVGEGGWLVLDKAGEGGLLDSITPLVVEVVLGVGDTAPRRGF